MSAKVNGVSASSSLIDSGDNTSDLVGSVELFTARTVIAWALVVEIDFVVEVAEFITGTTVFDFDAESVVEVVRVPTLVPRIGSAETV